MSKQLLQHLIEAKVNRATNDVFDTRKRFTAMLALVLVSTEALILGSAFAAFAENEFAAASVAFNQVLWQPLSEYLLIDNHRRSQHPKKLSDAIDRDFRAA